MHTLPPLLTGLHRGGWGSSLFVGGPRYRAVMRILLAWIFFAGIAAVSHLIAAPAVRAWSAEQVSIAAATEAAYPPLAAMVIGPIGGGLLEWMVPIIAIGAAVILTVQILAARVVRR